MQSHVATGIAESRILARGAGIQMLGEELGGLDVALDDMGAVARAQVARDVRRANVFAKNYAEQWAKNATGDTLLKAARTADAETLGSLRRTAVTESSEAFNDGRSIAAAELPETRTSLLKVWDATLDKRTCPICGAADGTIVGIRENFPIGTPGAVHPWCRCTWQVLTFDEHGAHGYIEPKEPAKVLPIRAAAQPIPIAPPAPGPRPTSPLHKSPQVAELLSAGFTGAVPQSGLRPESFAHLRAGGAVYGGIPTLKIHSDGLVSIVDGRHRITLARERGDSEMAFRVLVEGPRGGVKLDEKLTLKLGPAGTDHQRVIAAPKRKRK